MSIPLLDLPQELVCLTISFCQTRSTLNLSLTCSYLRKLIDPKDVSHKTKRLFLESWNPFKLVHTSYHSFLIRPQVISSTPKWDQSTISSYYTSPSQTESHVAFVLKRNPLMSMCFNDIGVEWDRIILIREYYHSTIFEITKSWASSGITEEIRESLLSLIVRGQNTYLHPDPPSHLLNL